MVKVLSDADEAASVINCADEEGWAPIHSAASIGHSEIMDILLSRGEKFVFRRCLLQLLTLFMARAC